MTPLSPNGKVRLLSFAALFATFFAGTMVGAAFTKVVSADDPPAQAEQKTERKNKTMIFDQLGLNAEQKVRIDSVIAKRRAQTDLFWDQHGPQMRSIVDSTRAEINRVLNDEQRARMEQWRQERRERHKQHEAEKNKP